MSKHETFAEYPSRSLAAAEAALLTIWPTLRSFHDNLVLVGGLVIHYPTRQSDGGWPVAVTMDVDFGIALAAEGVQYGTVQSDLSGLGFKPNMEQQTCLVVRSMTEEKIRFLQKSYFTKSAEAGTARTFFESVR